MYNMSCILIRLQLINIVIVILAADADVYDE